MKCNLIYISIILILLSSCNRKETLYKKIIKISKQNESYLVIGDDSNLVLKRSTEKDFEQELKKEYKYKYLLAYNYAMVDFNHNPKLEARKVKEFDLIVDSSNRNIKEIENSLGVIDSLLLKLYTGISIKLVKTHNRFSLRDIKTESIVNANNIHNGLISKGYLKNKTDFKVVVFDSSGFLNDASAVCLLASKDKLLMGDDIIFQNPVLFLHELFHAFDLRHAENIVCNNEPANIMDSRTIGCNHHIMARQIIMMNLQEYIPPIDKDRSFPECDTCIEYAGSDSVAETYVNSIDLHIDVLPVNGDDLLLNRFKDEMNGSIDLTIKNAIRKNYLNQGLAIGLNAVSANNYADRLIDLHIELRKKNLMRWLKFNIQDAYKENISFSELVLNPEKLDEWKTAYFNDYSDIREPNLESIIWCEQLALPCITSISENRVNPVGSLQIKSRSQSHNHRH